MGFFTPWFLAGAIAVGLPVWLHLLKRHKTEPKPFPSLMFFEHREQSSVQHRRLDYILLFILRLLMILLLVLLFANPYINRLTPKGAGQKLVVVAVDRSFSMRTKEGTSSRLELAKNEALDVLSKITPGQKAQVVALGNTLQAMTQQTNDPNELRGAVISIQESDSRASFGELARYLRTLSENTKTPLEVHLISDLQKSAMPPGFKDLSLDADTDLIFHPIGKLQPNWTVESVKAPAHIYDPKRVHIQVTVTGFQTPAATRTVSLIVNGKVVQSKSVLVPEGGRGSVEFIGLDASYGFNKCEVRIDSADGLPNDDRFAFAVERTDPKKVMFVDDGRRPDAEKYFRFAVEARVDGAFQVEKVTPEFAAGSNFAGYALVVLSDLGQGSMTPAFETALVHYVNGGGAVLESLGANAASMPRAPVLDEAIQGTRFASRSELFMTASDVDGSHDALAHVVGFDGVKFYQVVNVTPTKSRVLAKLGDGTPLVLERKIGEGDVLAFTATFDNTSSDLPSHNSWVAFVQDSVRYLGGGGAEQPVNLPVDSYVELRAGDQKTGAAAEVTDPDGHRVLSLEEAASAKNFALNREGFFEVKTAAGRRSLVAAYADRRESDLTPMPKENLDIWKASGSSGSPGSGDGGSGSEGNTRPWSLSPYILLLLLGVAMAESVVANGYLRPAAQPQQAK